jgi:hypothetical protein
MTGKFLGRGMLDRETILPWYQFNIFIRFACWKNRSRMITAISTPTGNLRNGILPPPATPGRFSIMTLQQAFPGRSWLSGEFP